MGLIPVRPSFKSPWQNGIAERWVESCGRDLLDHVIAMNEAHLKRLLSEYVSYFDEDRTHLGLQKETPGRRVRAAARGGVTGSLCNRAEFRRRLQRPELEARVAWWIRAFSGSMSFVAVVQATNMRHRHDGS